MSRRSSSPPKTNEGKQEVIITDILSPDIIEQIAFQLEKMGALRPWLQVSRGTNKFSKALGSFQLFLDLPIEIQNLILQQIGFQDIGNLLSVSNYINRSLKSKNISKIIDFDENKEYQKSKYSRFYALVRDGSISTIPDLQQTTLTNKQLSETINICSCSDNELKFIPPLPNCTILTCDDNQLTSLPDLPKCTILSCESNRLTSLPALPKCEVLECEKNQLSSLPDLPNCKNLSCKENQLTSLPQINKFMFINCSNNQLTSLPPLPFCKSLECQNNLLTSLPETLTNCEIVDCRKNMLTFLPALPNCKNLFCEKNQLTCLPELPKIKYLSTINNPLPSTLLIDKKEIFEYRRDEINEFIKTNC
jgi:hypothetical protein